MVGVFRGYTGATVGADAHAQYQLLQLGFAHLHLHWRGGGVPRRVKREVGGVEIPAVGQPLLGGHELGLVVAGPGRDAGQPRHQVCIKTAQTLDDQAAQLVGWPGVECHRQLGAAGDRINVGQGGAELAGGVALRGELAQCLLLGCSPARLGKAHARAQQPVTLNLPALGLRSGVVADRALEFNLHLTHHRGLAGHHAQIDLAGDGACTEGLLVKFDFGGEVTQRGHQFAGVFFGGSEQAREFVVAQVGQFAVTLQFQMALQQILNLRWRFNCQLKSLCRWAAGRVLRAR